jgi:hypothetical protein
MNVNSEKRLKKFNKKFFLLYKNHPNYEDIKTLYINDILKNINSVDKAFRKIKITKKGKVYKVGEESQKKIIEKVKKLTGADKLENNYVASRVIILDEKKIYKKKYGYLTNKIELDKIRKVAPNCYYIQVVQFFDGNNNLLNADSFIDVYDKLIQRRDFFTKTFDFIYENI